MQQAHQPHLRDLDARVSKLEVDIQHPKKDGWDKLGAVSGLASGILVALIGFYATNIYDTRSKEVEEADRKRNIVANELQTVEKFFPHLELKDETLGAADGGRVLTVTIFPRGRGFRAVLSRGDPERN